MKNPRVPRVVDRLGRPFDLVGTLRRSSFGDVYLAMLHPPVGPPEQVAVQLLARRIPPDPDTVAALHAEAERLTELDHPFVLAPREVTEIDERIALVSPYLEGAELGACLQGESRLPRSALLEVGERVAGALDAVWSQLGLVHRDVRPPNIRIGVMGEVRLVDFGVARRARSDVMVGTIAYLAPERFDPDHELDTASDVFSLGCVLYEGFTGSRTFDRVDTARMFELASDASAYHAFLHTRLGALRPGRAADLIAATLAHDPTERPSAAEVAWACASIAAEWPEAISLRAWCRDRRWPRPGPPPTKGMLEAATSKTVAPPPVRGPAGRPSPARPTPVPADPPRRWERRGLVAAVLGAIGVALAALSVVLLLLGLYWRQLEQAADAPVPDASQGSDLPRR
ncbi:MAG: protein kinase [Myxococcota bacterium]